MESQRNKVIVMVNVDDLKAAPWEPPTRLTERALQGIMRDIAQAGIMQAILIRPDYTIIDGHRRVECARRLGIKEVPAIITERDPKEAFAAVNDTTRKVNSREGLIIYMKGGNAPENCMRDIALVEEIGGKELLSAIYEANLAPAIVKSAVQVGLYCGFRDDKEMMKKTLYWLVKHRMQRNLRYACESGTPPAVIFRTITSDRPLTFKIVGG